MLQVSASPSIAFLVLLFAASLPSPTSGECTKHTCLNNGTCDTNYKEKGFKCICPQHGLADYGPRCELVVRSYISNSYTTGPPVYMKTKHALSDHPFSKGSMTITFEINAKCYSTVCNFFEIIGPDNSSFATFLLYQTQSPSVVYEISIWSPAHPDHIGLNRTQSINLKGTEMSSQTWNENWQSMHLHMWKSSQDVLTIHAQLCSLKMMICLDTTANKQYHGDLQSNLSQSVVLIGRFSGCIRYPRINGVLIDLGNVIGFEGGDNPYSSTFAYCDLSFQSCISISGTTAAHLVSKNYCGKDSKCHSSYNGNRCTCTCVSAKRRLRETIANNDKCTNSSLPENECTIETPIMSTDSSNYDVKWTAQNDGPISVGLSFFSIEATVKTRQTNVPEMLSLNNGNESLPQIRISNGHLEVCIGASCYPFPKVSVADDEWHSLSVTIRLRELTAMLDMSTTVHLLTTAFKFPGAIVTLSIPNSCVRAVRLSNVYMPTGDTDVTADNATAFIKVHMGSGVSAKTICTAKKDISACQCGAFEYCNVTSGSSICNCMTDFVRDKDGSCIHEVFFSPHMQFTKIAQKFRSGCTAIYASFSLLLLALNGPGIL